MEEFLKHIWQMQTQDVFVQDSEEEEMRKFQ